MAQDHDSEQARQMRVAASKAAARKKHQQEQDGKVFDQDEHGAGVIPERDWRTIKEQPQDFEGYL